jgi:hypothetical protein
MGNASLDRERMTSHYTVNFTTQPAVGRTALPRGLRDSSADVVIPVWSTYCLYGLGIAICSNSQLLMKLWISSTVGRTYWTGDQAVARPLPTQGSTAQHRKRRTNVHTLSDIRTHDPSIQATKTEQSQVLQLHKSPINKGKGYTS